MRKKDQRKASGKKNIEEESSSNDGHEKREIEIKGRNGSDEKIEFNEEHSQL